MRIIIEVQGVCIRAERRDVHALRLEFVGYVLDVDARTLTTGMRRCEGLK